MGAVIASPLMNSDSFVVICSGASTIKVLVQTDEGTVETDAMGMDCPLCFTPSAPPPAPTTGAVQIYPLAYALRPIEAARIAAVTAAPLPARGPPSLS
jgi:hypothetical protein